MREDVRAAAAVLCLLALSGCGPAPAPVADPVLQAPEAEPPAVAALPPDSVVAGSFVVTAQGERVGDVLHVHRLLVKRAGQHQAVQQIEGLETETPWPTSQPGLEAPDMNFDGHPDLRLMLFRAAGPNTPWRHWLYEPATERFVASPALDELSPTRFDSSHRWVVVDWRDGAARSGSDAYTWRDGQLQPADLAR